MRYPCAPGTVSIALLALTGCYDFENGKGASVSNLSLSDFSNHSLIMTPDPGAMNGGIDKWAFELAAPSSTVQACNSLGKTYTANSWTYDDWAYTLDITYTNSQSEYYEILSINDARTSGRFGYSNSIGTTPYEGSFQLQSGQACPL